MMLWILAVGCTGSGSGDDTATIDLVPTLTARGPWHAGYHQRDVTYTDPAGAERTLRTTFWYPASATDGGVPTFLTPLYDEDLWEDATGAQGQFPVFVWSHGHQGYAEASAFLLAHLASHGWLVVSPDHTNNTTWDGSDRDTHIYYQRPADLTAVLDVVLAATDLPVQADDSTVIAGGHSFGGYSIHAWAGAPYAVDELAAGCADGTGNGSYCSELTDELQAIFAGDLSDPRVDAFVATAAGDLEFFGTQGLGAIERPMLMMTGSEDYSDEKAEIWEGLRGTGHQHTQIIGGAHNVFTDYSGIIEEQTIDAQDGFDIVNAWVLAWAQVHAGDNSAQALLFGDEQVSHLAMDVP
jgi:predicted dienelactone hydrolase